MRSSIAGLAATAGCLLVGNVLAAHPLAAQSLERRISSVRNGTVHMTFASRPGLCGDGGDVIRSGSVMVIYPSMIGYGRSDREVCYTGPVRVSLGRDDGETVSLRVHIGGRWSSSDDATNLGTVSAPEAARYFLREATRLASRNSEWALAAAVFADSVQLWPDLVRLARDEDLRNNTRHRAVFWIGTYHEEGASRALRDLITDDGLGNEIRGAAIVAMGGDDITWADVTFLRNLYPKLSEKLRDNVFLAVSRSDDRRASAWLAQIATSSSETTHSREQAIFWLSQGRGPTSELIRLYDQLDGTGLRKHYTFALSQRHDDQALDKLIDIARRDDDRAVRKQAIFWLGQSKDPRAVAFLRDLVTR
jgi:HEAT repeat protein